MISTVIINRADVTLIRLLTSSPTFSFHPMKRIVIKYIALSTLIDAVLLLNGKEVSSFLGFERQTLFRQTTERWLLVPARPDSAYQGRREPLTLIFHIYVTLLVMSSLFTCHKRSYTV